jgi:hypothetical protein
MELWEMFEIKAGAFYLAATQLAGIASWVAATTAAAKEKTHKPFHEDRELDVPDRNFIRDKLEGLREHLDILGARVTRLAVYDAIDNLRYSGTTWGHAKVRLDEISNTLRRELSLVTLIALEPKEKSYFSPREPHFGADVAIKFPSAVTFEIDEAAKCFALGRSTASVFHLMRVMEVGIRAVARCLSIPDPTRAAERNWGSILRQIKADLDAHGGAAPTKAWTVAETRSFLRALILPSMRFA